MTISTIISAAVLTPQDITEDYIVNIVSGILTMFSIPLAISAGLWAMHNFKKIAAFSVVLSILFLVMPTVYDIVEKNITLPVYAANVQVWADQNYGLTIPDEAAVELVQSRRSTVEINGVSTDVKLHLEDEKYVLFMTGQALPLISEKGK